jgi:hypothetical protein
MELDAAAQQPAARGKVGDFGLLDEGHVGRGQAVLHDHRLDRRQQRLAGGSQQPLARHRRERHGDLQLGIIVSAGALEGVGPAVIEDIFALAVGLEIGRRRGEQRPVLAFDQDRRRSPAAALADAARFFQRGEKGVTEEGVARSGQRVPAPGIDGGDARRDARDQLRFTVGHRLPR